MNLKEFEGITCIMEAFSFGGMVGSSTGPKMKTKKLAKHWKVNLAAENPIWTLEIPRYRTTRQSMKHSMPQYGFHSKYQTLPILYSDEQYNDLIRSTVNTITKRKSMWEINSFIHWFCKTYLFSHCYNIYFLKQIYSLVIREWHMIDVILIIICIDVWKHRNGFGMDFYYLESICKAEAVSIILGRISNGFYYSKLFVIEKIFKSW